jgi:hypothetical protein
MALGYSPEMEEEQDVAGPLPTNPADLPPPGPAPETVMTPLGQIPASALPQGMAPVTPANSPDPAVGGPGAGAAPAAETDPGQSAPAAAPVLPPRPVRPPLTGDPAKDVNASLEYERALEDWHAQRLDAATTTQNDIRKQQHQEELRIAQEAEARRQAEQKAREEELAQRRKAISDATEQRAKAIGDLESGKWKEQSTGAKLASIIAMGFGAVGAGLSAAGGHPTGNLAAQAVDNLLKREYDHAQQKVANANQSILEARYGYKDAEDNHRAALNDIDADMAAKYKLVAKQAAAEMEARGVSPEQIASDSLVVGSLQKAQQYEDSIHAREIEAQRKAEMAAAAEEQKLASARASDALADWRNRRQGGSARAAGAAAARGMSKSAAKAQTQELKDIEAAAKPYINAQVGSAKSPGSLKAYESAVAVSNELKRAAKSGDPDAMKIAVLHAQEQSTRFLTNAAPTQQTFAIQHELASTPEQLQAKLAGIIGQPTEAKAYVIRMAQNIDAIARQRKEVMDATVGEAATRLQSIAKSEEGKKRMQGILDSLAGKRAGESAAPKKTQKIGKAVYEFGEDGNWHKVKADTGDIKL